MQDKDTFHNKNNIKYTYKNLNMLEELKYDC